MATTYSDSIAKVGRHVFGDAATYPIRKIELSDLGEALRLGGCLVQDDEQRLRAGQTDNKS